MKIGTFFKDIGKGLKWFGEHLVGDLPQALSKLITLSHDAEQISSDAAQEVIAVATDVGNLVAAVSKDDGASLQAIEQLIAAGEAAIAAEGLNPVQDAAVLTAAQKFFASLNGTNYADVLATISKVIADGKSMTQTVIQDFKKLEHDATA